MSFNVSAFRSNLPFGGAKASLFEVELSGLPTGIEIPNGGKFLIKASSLPETTLGVTEVSYFGRKIKLPGDRTYAEWQITVINDEDFAIRNAMESWVALLNAPEANVRTLAGNFTGTAAIKQYSKTGTGGVEEGVIKSYKFVNLFPTTVSAIDMNWETVDQIEDFTVTFQYDYFLPISAPQVA